MTWEDIEQVIKDQLEIWVENPEKQKEKDKGKGKERETVLEKRKDPEKEKEKKESKGKEENTTMEKHKEEAERRKASIGEKWPSTTDTGSSPRKKRKSSKPTYQVVLHNDDLETNVDRVYDTISTLITAITTAQEAIKQTIETQIIELKTLVSHAPQVATPSIVASIVIDPEGNWHKFITVMTISICRPTTQEGLQEDVVQLDLVALPSETLRTL